MNNIALAISVVVFTKNESSNIAACILSLKDFSEVVVIDSLSTDGTQSIARDLGARVVDFSWDNKYPKKRQWSLESVDYQNKWILFVDADERVTESFITELRDFVNSHFDEFGAASIPISYYFAGKRLKHGQKLRKTALLRLGRAHFPEINDLLAEGMGELEGHYQPVVHGKVRKFRSGLIHNDKDLISTWMIRHINYSKWEAHLLLNREVKNIVDSSKGKTVALFHKLPNRPFVFFVYSYILKAGFLDGRAGFDYAFAKSWYYWLSDVIAREKILNDR